MRSRPDEPPGDRRIDPRYPIRVPTEYQHPSVVGRGTTWDVSLSGVRIADATFQIRVGAGVMIRFSFFPGSFETWFPANVVRHTNDGFAVRFEPLSEDQIAVLRRALPGDGGNAPSNGS